jgi:hypothetical protein
VKITRLIFLILLIATSLISCSKDEVKAGEKVEIYLLKTVNYVSGKCLVDPQLSILEDTAIIKNQDILFYSPTDYQFTFTDTVFKKLNDYVSSHNNTVIAIMVDKELIYYSVYNNIFSSSGCPHSITFYLDAITKNKIQLFWGGISNDDQRNNQKLIATLGNQGKLK